MAAPRVVEAVINATARFEEVALDNSASSIHDGCATGGQWCVATDDILAQTVVGCSVASCIHTFVCSTHP